MARGESSFKYHLLGQQVRDHTLVVSGLASPPKFFFFFFFFENTVNNLDQLCRCTARGTRRCGTHVPSMVPRARGHLEGTGRQGGAFRK